MKASDLIGLSKVMSELAQPLPITAAGGLRLYAGLVATDEGVAESSAPVGEKLARLVAEIQEKFESTGPSLLRQTILGDGK